MIERVNAIYSEATELDKTVSDLFLSWVTSRGANEADINQMALQIFRKKIMGQQGV